MSIFNLLVHSCESGIEISGGVEEKNSSNILQESQVLFNKKGVTVHGTKTAPYISFHKADFSNNDYTGILLQNLDDKVAYSESDTVLLVTDTIINGNKRSGFETADNVLTDVLVNNCTFELNGMYGFYFNRYYSSSSARYNNITVTASKFIKNSRDGFYAYSTSAGPANILISRNSFSDNSQRAIYSNLDMAGDHNSYLDISENIFASHTNTYYHTIIIEERTGSVGVHIRNIRNNSFIESVGGIQISLNNVDRRVSVSYNSFQNMYGTSNSVIKVSNALLEFTYNNIENSSTEALVEIENGYNHTIRSNRFASNEAASCYIKINSVFDSEKKILVSDNYWEMDSIYRIKEKICDFFVNIKVARAEIKSYFLDYLLTSRQEVVSEDAFRRPANVVNGSYVYEGIIYDAVRGLEEDNATVQVNRSIIIEESGRLEILGSHVFFAENRGIVVKGMHCKYSITSMARTRMVR